jgi:hypothetical protein
MKSFKLSLLAIGTSVSVGCASVPPPAPAAPEEPMLSADAWHPQDDGLQMVDAPKEKRREEAVVGPLSPERQKTPRGALVNMATKQ